VPESILIQAINKPNILKDYQSRSEFLKNYFQPKLKEKFGNSVNFDLKIIPSVGSYTAPQRDEKTDFVFTLDNYTENITTKFFVDLIDIEGELIFDLSTGFNLFVQSLTDTAKSIIVYRNLQYILQKKEEIGVKILIIPPILRGNRNQIFPIEEYDYEAKIFFDFPFKELDINSNLIDFTYSNLNAFKTDRKEICLNSPKIEKISRDIINLTKISFNSVKYNVPLAFFEKSIIDFSKIDQDKLNKESNRIKGIYDYIGQYSEMEKNDGSIVIRYLKILKNKVINYCFTLALFRSFKKFCHEITEKTPTLGFIKSRFSELYKILDLGSNTRFLERDLKNIDRHKDKLEIKETKLLEILENEKYGKDKIHSDNSRIYSDPKRNFLAHSGLLKNFVKLKKNQDGKLEINYISKHIDTIKHWLMNPEG
jgi:hypothetical protein